MRSKRESGVQPQNPRFDQQMLRSDQEVSSPTLMTRMLAASFIFLRFEIGKIAVIRCSVSID